MTQQGNPPSPGTERARSSVAFAFAAVRDELSQIDREQDDYSRPGNRDGDKERKWHSYSGFSAVSDQSGPIRSLGITLGSAAAPALAEWRARGRRVHFSVTSAAAERRRQLHPIVLRL